MQEPYNVKLITNNIKKVFDSNDISLLSKASYNFLYLMSGFIAHYNIEVFKDYYEDVSELAGKLCDDYYLSDAEMDETDEDFDKWYGKEYNKSKADIKRELHKLANEYLNKKLNKFLDVNENWVE